LFVALFAEDRPAVAAAAILAGHTRYAYVGAGLPLAEGQRVYASKPHSWTGLLNGQHIVSIGEEEGVVTRDRGLTPAWTLLTYKVIGTQALGLSMVGHLYELTPTVRQQAIRMGRKAVELIASASGTIFPIPGQVMSRLKRLHWTAKPGTLLDATYQAISNPTGKAYLADYPDEWGVVAAAVTQSPDINLDHARAHIDSYWDVLPNLASFIPDSRPQLKRRIAERLPQGLGAMLLYHLVCLVLLWWLAPVRQFVPERVQCKWYDLTCWAHTAVGKADMRTCVIPPLSASMSVLGIFTMFIGHMFPLLGVAPGILAWVFNSDPLELCANPYLETPVVHSSALFIMLMASIYQARDADGGRIAVIIVSFLLLGTRIWFTSLVATALWLACAATYAIGAVTIGPMLTKA
jgi:hypothetical protein